MSAVEKNSRMIPSWLWTVPLFEACNPLPSPQCSESRVWGFVINQLTNEWPYHATQRVPWTVNGDLFSMKQKCSTSDYWITCNYWSTFDKKNSRTEVHTKIRRGWKYWKITEMTQEKLTCMFVNISKCIDNILADFLPDSDPSCVSLF